MNIKNVIYKAPLPHYFLFLGIAVVATYIFSDALLHLSDVWSKREEYSHGFIIPFIAAFFIYQNKNELSQVEFNGSWFGYLLISVGLIFAIVGDMTTIFMVVQYAMVLTFAGVLYTYLGYMAFKYVVVALLVLLFMIPLPEFLYDNLSQELQLLSSDIGVRVIRLFDISVYLEGNVIDLGVYKLQVVDACSGLRYLFPLMCFGFICAYIFKAPLWQRAIIFFTTIPITVFMNSFRIGVIGVLVNYWGIKHAEGFLHDFEGWIIFMACVGVLFIEMWLLTYIFQGKSNLKEVFAVELPAIIPTEHQVIERKTSSKLYFILPIFILAAIVSTTLSDRVEIIPEREKFVSYPDTVGLWQGKRNKLEQIYLDSLVGLSDYIIADYFKPNGEHVNFYGAYYATQSSTGSIHSPRNCMPGGGWKIQKLTKLKVNGDQSGHVSFNVNRALIQLGDYKQLVYYWFPQRGRNLTDEYVVKWYMFYDSIFKKRSDGTLLRISTEIKSGESDDIADKRLQAFLSEAYPLLDEHLPD